MEGRPPPPITQLGSHDLHGPGHNPSQGLPLLNKGVGGKRGISSFADRTQGETAETHTVNRIKNRSTAGPGRCQCLESRKSFHCLTSNHRSSLARVSHAVWQGAFGQVPGKRISSPQLPDPFLDWRCCQGPSTETRRSSNPELKTLSLSLWLGPNSHSSNLYTARQVANARLCY